MSCEGREGWGALAAQGKAEHATWGCTDLGTSLAEHAVLTHITWDKPGAEPLPLFAPVSSIGVLFCSEQRAAPDVCLTQSLLLCMQRPNPSMKSKAWGDLLHTLAA